MQNNSDIFDPTKKDNLNKMENSNSDIFDPNVKTETLSDNLFNNLEEREHEIDFTNQDYLTGKEDPLRQDLDEIRAYRQSNFDKTMTGVGRVGVKVLAEVAKMPGMIGGLVAAIATPFGDDPAVETIFDNAWIRTIEDANQYINNEALPVYVKNSVKNGSLMDNLTSIDFWATEGADGVGYIASMFVPGAALKSLGLGKIMMNSVTKGANSMYKSAEAAQNALKTIKATDKGMDVFNATVANTFFEAGAESGGAMRAFENKKENFINKQLEKGLTEEEAEKLFTENKADLGRNIFWSNVAILVGPNAISNKILFGAKGGSKVASQYLDDAGKFIKDPKSLLTKGRIEEYAGEFGKGFAREGFWEEAMQSSVEHKFMDKAEGKETGLLDSYLHTLTSVEGQKAIALGGILGGPMNVYSQISNNKATKKRKAELAPHMESMINLYTMGTDKLYTVDENGKREINDKYVTEYGNEVKKLEALDKVFDEMNAIKEANDGVLPAPQKARLKVAQNDFTSSFLMPFITNGEMGVEILEKALSQNEDIIDKVNASNEVTGENQTKKSVVTNIVEQAKSMQKDYEKSSEYLKYFNPIKGEDTEKVSAFYNQMNAFETFTKQRKRFLESNKIEVENEVTLQELELLKEYALQTEQSTKGYNKFKDDVGLSLTLEEFNAKNLGYGTSEEFLNFANKKNKGNNIYGNKLREQSDISNSIIQQNAILDMLYDPTQLQNLFDLKVEQDIEAEKTIKEETVKKQEEEVTKKEDSEKEIIKKDNKEKKTQERKKVRSKKVNLVKQVDNNNALFDILTTKLSKTSEDLILEPLTQELIDIIVMSNPELKDLNISNQIKYNKANESTLVVEILNENYKSIVELEVSRKEVPKESNPNPKTNPTVTTNDQQEEVDNVEEENSNLKEINEEEKILLKEALDIKDYRDEKFKETSIIDDTDFIVLYDVKAGEESNSFSKKVSTIKDKTYTGLVSKIKAKYQADRDALNKTNEGERSAGVKELISVYSGGKLFFPINASGLEVSESFSANKVTLEQAKAAIPGLNGKIRNWFQRGVNYLQTKKNKSSSSSQQPGNEFTNSDNISTGGTINEGTSNDINRLPENTVNRSSESHAKLVDSKGNLSADPLFFQYSEEQRDKKGEEVTFELGNGQTNDRANEALFLFRDVLDNNGTLTEEEIDSLVQFLPIKVNVANGGFSHLSFANEELGIEVFAAAATIKRNVIMQMLEGKKPKSIIMFQKPGRIQMDRVDGKPAANKIFDENGKSNLFGVESIDKVEVLFSDSIGVLKNSSNKTTESFGTVKNAGQIYISVPMANGRKMPLKLNQRRINNIEAELLYKIVEVMIGSSIKLTYKDSLDMLIKNSIFTELELEYINTELKALDKNTKNTTIIDLVNNLVYEGQSDKNAFSIEGSSLRMQDELISSENFKDAKPRIIEWLTTEKNRQINKKASNTVAYKKHLFNSILSTDSKLGQAMFQDSTAIYIDPNLGIDPLQVKANKKKKAKSDLKEKIEKTPIKILKENKKSKKETLEDDANQISAEEKIFLDNLENQITMAENDKEAKETKDKAEKLEDVIKPVVKVKSNSRNKSKFVNIVSKVNKINKEDEQKDDLDPGCNK